MADMFYTWDIGTSLNRTDIRSVSELMMAALNPYGGEGAKINSLVEVLKKGSPINNFKHEWIEEDLNPGAVIMASGSDVDGSTTGTTFVCSNLETVRVGDYLRNMSKNIDEVMRVTAINTSTKTLTVERGFGVTDASDGHAEGDMFRIMNVSPQGSQLGDDMTRPRRTRYNYTHILTKDIVISRTVLETAMYNVKDEFENSLKKRIIEIKNDLNDNVINSIGSPEPDANTRGSMHGIIPMIKTGGDITRTSYIAPAAGTNIDPTTTLTFDALSDLIGLVAVKNGNRSGNYVVATGQEQYEIISTWPAGQVRRQYSGTGQTYGEYVDAIITKQAIEAKVVLDTNIPPGHLLVLDVDRIVLRPLGQSALLIYTGNLGDNGNDFKWGRLVAEWTVEVHNADKAHAIMPNLS